MGKGSKILGETRVMANGQKATCIKYSSYFDIDVRFEDGTLVQHKRKDAFYNGSIVNPNKIGEHSATPKNLVGLSLTMNNGQKATCIAYRGFGDIDVRFEDGAIVEHRRKDSFLGGGIENPNYNSDSCLGKTAMMNCGMKATCIAYRKFSDIDVKFDDGTIVFHANGSNFTRGAIANPTTISCAGETRTMKSGRKATCTAFRKTTDIDVRFDNGEEILHTTKWRFYAGTLKAPSDAIRVFIPKTPSPTQRLYPVEINGEAKQLPAVAIGVGAINLMSCGERAECIAAKNAHDFSIRFEDGEIVSHISRAAFLSGKVRDKKFARSQCLKSHAGAIESVEREWNPAKNGFPDLSSYILSNGTAGTVWWLLPYDDPRTGKHFDFEWKARIQDRVVKGEGCPFIGNKKVWPGFNDLATTNPELAGEWHPTKNLPLTPRDVTGSSGKKVWWLLPYDDPRTGKHFDFEWEACISSRKNGGCPYLSSPSKALFVGFNDLATLFPEIAKEWHPTKNGSKRPEDFLPGSGFVAWWLLPYDDPRTGKHFDFEWKSAISARTANDLHCPFISSQKLWPGFNDLATTDPDLLASWDWAKNKIKPTELGIGSHFKVWWKCARCGFEWKTIPSNRKRTECPNCNSYLSSSFPEQAIFFFLKKYFPDTISRDKHLGFELDVFVPSINFAVEYDGKAWHRDIQKDIRKDASCKGKVHLVRVREKGCPPLPDGCEVISVNSRIDDKLEAGISKVLEAAGISGEKIDLAANKNEIMSNYRGLFKEGSLAFEYPELAEEWHPTKNGSLKPENYAAMSNQVVWWLFPYDDPRTGKHFDFEWKDTIAHRTKSPSCPFLTNKRVWRGFNDLATTNPEILLDWDFAHNEKQPYEITSGSEYRGKFICHVCGRPYERTIYTFKRTHDCPFCAQKKNGNIHSKRVLDIETGTIYESITEASKKTGTDKMGICNCCKGKIKTSGKHHWKYV